MIIPSGISKLQWLFSRDASRVNSQNILFEINYQLIKPEPEPKKIIKKLPAFIPYDEPTFAGGEPDIFEEETIETVDCSGCGTFDDESERLPLNN